MMKITQLIIFSCLLLTGLGVKAGNPDRQGEAGAGQLLINPFARGAGLHDLIVAHVRGVEAIQINPAGLGHIKGTEIVTAYSDYLVGTDIALLAAGVGQPVGESGVLGLSMMSIDYGKIQITTEGQPEGIGATFSPLFFNMGLSYAHVFSERISIGATLRLISESIYNVSALGVAIDAGAQYRTKDFRFGISLRNVGMPMVYRGDGLSFVGGTPDPQSSHDLTVNQRSQPFELPSQLSMGVAYDLKGQHQRLTMLGNFIANSFTKDQYGVGLEYAFKETVMLRLAYKHESNLLGNSDRTNIQTGLSGGFSLELPLKKGGDKRLGIDYAYRTSNPFGGTHTVGLRLNL